MTDFVPNPCTPGGRKPVALITDRAKRYRANQCKPAQTEQRCLYCGAAKRGLLIDHIDGHEAHNAQHNLAWACRSCNARKGAVFARKRAGTRTRQYNPAPAGGGAKTLAAWLEALRALKGDGNMKLSDAIALVHATPASKRSEFARDIWSRRRARGTDRQAVPF